MLVQPNFFLSTPIRADKLLAARAAALSVPPLGIGLATYISAFMRLTSAPV